MPKKQRWERFQKYYFEYPGAGFALDISRVDFPDDLFSSMEAKFEGPFAAMAELEKGAIANPDENRMVGHYWLRAPSLAPTPEIRSQIEETVAAIKRFAARVHEARIQGSRGPFKNILLIGIGGSALGPQFVANALSEPTTDKMDIYFFDNTDPDGMDRVLSKIITELGQTLCLVISKSGGTKETRNGMIEAAAAFNAAGLHFAQHAVAVTGENSELDRVAAKEGWLARFPMWDWIGGRTSELSAVGLLPAALQGFNIDDLLDGAARCDELTRISTLSQNPAAILALMWFHIGEGRGAKDMVIVPYKDRLDLLSKYMQQLVMESLGKEIDKSGVVVNQGIAVYGNKGSTDQHAYIQQLRDGINNFFVTFIEVLKERSTPPLYVDPDTTSGDYLSGFLMGTREALHEKQRDSITITIREINARVIGCLIALFERTVGLYALLVNINAYHQPGVEAGKLAAARLLDLQRKILDYLRSNAKGSFTAEQIALAVSARDEAEAVFKICEHLGHCVGRGIRIHPGSSLSNRRYELT